MTDEELIELLRRMSPRLDMLDCENVLTAADRIEQLAVTNEALQKALKDQSSVSDRLAEQLATCEKYRDAYAECDRIGTQAARDLEDKLALMIFERDEVMMCERDEAWKRAAHSEKMWGEAEVKLTKAVEALRDMCAEFRSYDLPYGSKAYFKGISTLAELEGK